MKKVLDRQKGESKNQYGEFGIEDYLSDGVIHLTMERTGDTVARKVSVVKMRHTDHILGYQPYRWDSSNSRFTVN